MVQVKLADIDRLFVLPEPLLQVLAFGGLSSRFWLVFLHRAVVEDLLNPLHALMLLLAGVQLDALWRLERAVGLLCATVAVFRWLSGLVGEVQFASLERLASWRLVEALLSAAVFLLGGLPLLYLHRWAEAFDCRTVLLEIILFNIRIAVYLLGFLVEFRFRAAARDNVLLFLVCRGHHKVSFLCRPPLRRGFEPSLLGLLECALLAANDLREFRLDFFKKLLLVSNDRARPAQSCPCDRMLG